MTEIQIEQGTPEWLELRRDLRMASESAAVMGKSPYSSANDIRAAKRGQKAFVNAAMARGSELEPLARLKYEDQHELMRPCFFTDGTYAASLDGINIDQTMLLEIKCPWNGKESERWAAAAQGLVLDHDNIQIQHQLMVSPATKAHLWVFDGQEGILVEVIQDEAIQAEIRAAWDAFWPTLTQREDAQWAQKANAWKAAKAVLKGAEEAEAKAKDELLKLFGDSDRFVAGSGVEVTRISRAGSIDWSKVEKDYLGDIDVEQYRKKGTSYITVKEVE